MEQDTNPSTAPDTWNCFGEWAAIRNAFPMPFDKLYGPPRSKCPVQRITMPDGSPAWAVLGQPEVETVLMDPKRFSNAMCQYGPSPLIPLECDPPEHTPYRRILNRLINKEVAESLAPRVRRYAVDLLAPVIAAGGGDLRPVAEALALRVLCGLLGVEDSEWTTIRDSQSGRTVAQAAHTTADAVGARFKALAPVIEYAKGLIERRRLQPKDDLVSGLIAAHLPDRPLTDDEILQMLTIVLLGGHETTRSAMLSSAMLLSQYPEVQTQLRARPELIPTAIEECLRLESPVQGMFRLSTEDLELAGAPIAKGSLVMPFFGAANTDPSVHADPMAFNFERKASHNYAFGRGTHLCVGAPLARMELRVFMEELLARTAHFNVAAPVEREQCPDLTMRQLVVQLTPAS